MIFGIEEKIRQAMEEGKFDHLRGKGKPLQLEENPLVDPEWRTAFHVLHSNGFTLPWIETYREIQASLETARLDLARARKRRLAAESGDAQAGWQQAVTEFRERIAAINKRIFNYNLEVPGLQFQRPLLQAEKEIQTVCEEVRASC